MSDECFNASYIVTEMRGGDVDGKYLANKAEYEQLTAFLEANGNGQKLNSRYVLLPTWVLTYPNKQNKDDPYYYAMNGCTGEVCGKLPFDKKKLNRNGLLLGAAIFVVGCLLSYFVF